MARHCRRRQRGARQLSGTSVENFSVAGLLVVHDAAQGIGIQNADMSLPHFHGAFFYELGERAAYGFKL